MHTSKPAPKPFTESTPHQTASGRRLGRRWQHRLALLACTLGLLSSAPVAARTYHLVDPYAARVIDTVVRRSISAVLVAADAQHGAALAAQVARLLRWKGDIVRDVHPNDALTLAYRLEDGQPRLVALVYRGLAIHLSAFPLLDGDGVLRLYDSRAGLIEPRLRHSPTDYQQITETVQSGRGKRRHRGIDLKAPTGTPIRAPFAARVSRVNWSTRINGNCVDLVYTAGRAAGLHGLFLHLDQVDNLRPGQRLSPGQKFATVGNTGRSSAAHLHYEIRDRRGRVRDPMVVHTTEAVRLTGRWRELFHRSRLEWLEALGVSSTARPHLR